MDQNKKRPVPKRTAPKSADKNGEKKSGAAAAGHVGLTLTRYLGKIVTYALNIILTVFLIAIITGAVTLLGVIISNSKAQAVTDTKLEELTREVREHNNFARRMPVVEEKIQGIERRLGDLENKG